VENSNRRAFFMHNEHYSALAELGKRLGYDTVTAFVRAIANGEIELKIRSSAPRRYVYLEDDEFLRIGQIMGEHGCYRSDGETPNLSLFLKKISTEEILSQLIPR